MMTNSGESVFLHLEKLINDLQDLGFLTECVRNYIVAYVRHLEYLQHNISETIKTYVLDFDEQFYNDKFKISHITRQIRNIPFNDPFYPLLEQTKTILADLNSFKEICSLNSYREELHNITTKRVYVLIIQYRKEFLKDMIGLMCNTYTVITKSSETRANLETDVKIAIDELFKREISEQHLKFFVDFNMDIRSTNDYNEMCMYLKVLKIFVNNICILISDSMTGDEITTTEFDQFVPGCPIFANEHFNSTFETLKYQTEATDINIEPSFHKRSLLTAKESINDTTNITSQGFLRTKQFTFCV